MSSKSEISINGLMASDSAKGDRGGLGHNPNPNPPNPPNPSQATNSGGVEKMSLNDKVNLNNNININRSQDQDGGENKDNKADNNQDNMVVIDQSIKHPLQNFWTLWFFKNDRSRDWNDNQREITTVNTVEDFWGLYNHIELPSKIPPSCDYSMFKLGIKPMWEDPLNQKGGKWLLVLLRRQKGELLDCIWLDILMALIGEGFGNLGKHVNGAVVSVKASLKIALWLGSDANDDEILEIGTKFKELMRLDHTYELTYENHTESMNKVGSMARSRFRL